MAKILGIPLPRGNLRFNTQEFERGRAFFNEDKSVQINAVSSYPDGGKTIRIIYENVDTIFGLWFQSDNRCDEDHHKFVYWYIGTPSYPEKYFYTTSSEHFEHIHFKGYNFSSTAEEIECLIMMADFLWMYDGSNISGDFEVKHVGINKLIYERLFGAGA